MGSRPESIRDLSNEKIPQCPGPCHPPAIPLRLKGRVSSLRTALLVNAKSRRGAVWFAEAHDRLQALGVPLEESVLVHNPHELLDHFHRMKREGIHRLVLGGGDGTFSLVARHLVKAQMILGVLPLGTGNAFARDLGIPTRIDRACEIIAEGNLGRVDLGLANNDYFLNVATVGLTTYIAQNLRHEEKRMLGPWAYALSLMRSWHRVEPFHCEFRTHETREEFDALQVVIGNGRYHAGPFLISPHAELQDGRLSMYAVTKAPPARLLRVAVAFAFGRHPAEPDVFHLETTGGRLTTDPVRPVTVDGEVCTETPLHFSVAQRVLQVHLPPEGPARPNEAEANEVK